MMSNEIINLKLDATRLIFLCQVYLNLIDRELNKNNSCI